MRNVVHVHTLSAVALASAALMGCGPKLVTFDPTTVAAIEVHPAGGKKVFCPGTEFQVEVLATFSDGSKCSNINRDLECQQHTNTVIEPEMVRLEGSAGKQTGKKKKFLWAPPDDVLETADMTITLRGWLEKENDAGDILKSIVGKSKLHPVYTCRMAETFAGNAGDARGPDIHINITPLKTPFYPDAALIRVDVGESNFYYISPTADQRVHIVDAGPEGHPGAPGRDGARGENGPDAPAGSPACTRGGNGRDGQDGGAGSPGGDGGPGGPITISIDKAAPSDLRDRVLVESVGGAGGPGGRGGYGGAGGDPGTGVSGPGCYDSKGDPGRKGRDGASSSQGRQGLAGPTPVWTTATRDAMFAKEMPLIDRIEGRKSEGKKNDGTKNDGTKNDGTKNDGTKNDGTKPKKPAK